MGVMEDDDASRAERGQRPRPEDFDLFDLLRLVLCLLLAGCATARVVPVDLRALDYNGCLLDVELRASGSFHESATCDADRPDPASPP